DATLRDLVQAISRSRRNTFPVVSEEGKLAGIVHLDDVRETIFRNELYDKVTVAELMTPPDATISPNDNLHEVLKKFDETNQWNLPMVDKGRYLGFLLKSSILTRYRSELVQRDLRLLPAPDEQLTLSGVVQQILFGSYTQYFRHRTRRCYAAAGFAMSLGMRCVTIKVLPQCTDAPAVQIFKNGVEDGMCLRPPPFTAKEYKGVH